MYLKKKKETILHIGYPSRTTFCSDLSDLEMFQDMQKWGTGALSGNSK